MQVLKALTTSLVLGLCCVARAGISENQPGGSIEGSEPSGRDALDTFTSLWTDSRAWTPPAGFVYHLRRIVYSSQSADAIRARLAAISANPDHPDRAGLESDLRRAESGADVYDITVWLDAPDQFRYSQTVRTSGGATSEADAVNTRISKWRLSEGPSGTGSLFIFEPGQPDPPAANLLGAADSIRQHLCNALTGGLASPFPVEPTRAEWRGSTLVGIAESAEWQIEFRFVPSPEGALELMGTESRQKEPAQPFGSRHIDQWIDVSDLGTRVAARWESRTPDGHVREALEWVGVRALADDEFARVTAVPRADGKDVLRGPHTFTTVWDYRDGAGILTTDIGGALNTVPIPPEMRGRSGDVPWKVIGWISAGTLTATLLGWKLRARQRLA